MAGKEREQPKPQHPELGSALTLKQRKVLALVAQGLTGPQIAEQLYISPRTLEAHRKNIRDRIKDVPLLAMAEATGAISRQAEILSKLAGQQNGRENGGRPLTEFMPALSGLLKEFGLGELPLEKDGKSAEVLPVKGTIFPTPKDQSPEVDRKPPLFRIDRASRIAVINGRRILEFKRDATRNWPVFLFIAENPRRNIARREIKAVEMQTGSGSRRAQLDSIFKLRDMFEEDRLNPTILITTQHLRRNGGRDIRFEADVEFVPDYYFSKKRMQRVKEEDSKSDLTEHQARVAFSLFALDQDRSGFLNPSFREVIVDVYEDQLPSDLEERRKKMKNLSGSIATLRDNIVRKMRANWDKTLEQIPPRIKEFIEWLRTQPEYKGISLGDFISVCLRAIIFDELKKKTVVPASMPSSDPAPITETTVFTPPPTHRPAEKPTSAPRAPLPPKRETTVFTASKRPGARRKISSRHPYGTPIVRTDGPPPKQDDIPASAIGPADPVPASTAGKPKETFQEKLRRIQERKIPSGNGLEVLSPEKPASDSAFTNGEIFALASLLLDMKKKKKWELFAAGIDPASREMAGLEKSASQIAVADKRTPYARENLTALDVKLAALEKDPEAFAEINKGDAEVLVRILRSCNNLHLFLGRLSIELKALSGEFRVKTGV